MNSSYRLFFISTILILLIVQVNGGYWICDWVGRRGWMYCSRGVCNTFLGKRSITLDDDPTGPLQNDDGTYCLEKHFCYRCQPFNSNMCRITLQKDYIPMLKSDSFDKREDDDICS